MSDVRCKTCRYFLAGQVIGACRRFPEVQNKHEMDWCGEHQLPVMVTMPLYDIMTDETVMAKVPVSIKKPGRKPKNATAPAA